MKADGARKHLIRLVFNDGRRLRSLDAANEQEVSEILDGIRACGYDLIAVEGRIPGLESVQQD